MSVSTLVTQVHARVFAMLSAVTIDAVAINVFEEHPSDPTFPYVTFSVAFDAFGDRHAEGSAQIDVWGNNGGAEVTTIIDAINGALDRKSLGIVGGKAVLLASATHSIGRDGDGTTRHGIQIYRFLLQS